MSARSGELSIRIPPDAAQVAAVRAFVGAVGRQAGCSEETIDDLRLVATEACAQAIEEEAAHEGIVVRTVLDEGRRLVLEIRPSGSFERPPEGLDGASAPSTSTRRALIEGLFPDAEFDPRGGVLRVGASPQDD
jgi:anti-sigma regulatory factor (Ser/Thr protein kinase)